METIYLAGGCFWCTEAVFRALKGVLLVTPGYMGGHVENPTYAQVCEGNTGHAETIKIEYDPKVISTEDILQVFFDSHDPTTLDRQGADVGPQYRSAIFYTEHAQKEIAEKVIEKVNKNLPVGKHVVTEIVLAEDFYPGEAYHQDYYANNPDKMYCQIVISPKIEKLKKEHGDLTLEDRN